MDNDSYDEHPIGSLGQGGITCEHHCLLLVGEDSSIMPTYLTHSQLLAKLKSESKYKTTDGGGVGARSLAHNTLRGRGAYWSFGMGLGRVDKLHSLTRTCTQPTQGG